MGGRKRNQKKAAPATSAAAKKKESESGDVENEMEVVATAVVDAPSEASSPSKDRKEER